MGETMARLEVWVGRLALALALTGGATLVAMIVLTVVSVTGRGMIWAGLGPVPGDYELVEMGAAFAIFAFLPWCQLQRGHVTVDLFLSAAGATVNRAVDLIADILLTLAAGVIAWRLWLGLIDKYRFTETTFILQVPSWWGYGLAMVGAAVFVAVGAFTVLRSAVALRAALAGGGKDTAP